METFDNLFKNPGSDAVSVRNEVESALDEIALVMDGAIAVRADSVARAEPSDDEMAASPNSVAQYVEGQYGGAE